MTGKDGDDQQRGSKA